MSKNHLTKEEAINLISSIVDDEADENTRTAFLNYIKNDTAVRYEFESMKRIKTLIATRCPTHKAPDELKVRVQEFLLQKRNKRKASSSASDDRGDPVIDIPSNLSSPSGSQGAEESSKKEAKTHYKKWIYAAAATFLIIAAFWGLVYNSQSVENTYSMEEYVYQHFQKNEGKLVPPNISTASLTDAEVTLSSNFDMPMTVPPLTNAQFKGVAISEFVPGFEAPLLEYYLPEQDQYIYIFAFKMEQLNKFGKLARDEEAIKKCIKPNDFHIEEINGKHVVSWRWDGTWYAAISNHNGKTLASLVEPLKYDLEQ